MRIIVAGGKNKADFLIGSLLKKKHTLTVINDDPHYCEYLSQTYNIPIICGDPSKDYVLDDADIYGYDLIIALKPNDADNLAICQTAKRLYNVKKSVAVVSNPKSVEIFQKLGVNTAISATYMVAHIIEQASTIESLVNSLTIESDKVLLTELLVNIDSPVINKTLKNIDLGEGVIIGCILRGNELIIPSGKTEISQNDKLVILSSPDKQEAIIKTITGGNA